MKEVSITPSDFKVTASEGNLIDYTDYILGRITSLAPAVIPSPIYRKRTQIF